MIYLPESIIEVVRRAANKKMLFLPHAVNQMSRPERVISIHEVRHVIEKGGVIEDYSDDPRGHSCLILGKGIGGRPVHVVCSPKEDFLAIITPYLPSEAEWKNNYSERKRP